MLRENSRKTSSLLVFSMKISLGRKSLFVVQQGALTGWNIIECDRML